ncbi:protein of unknown function [Aminobacter niigataensis]|nr:protein of unknown function [Aminobacter niigataensis]
MGVRGFTSDSGSLELTLARTVGRFAISQTSVRIGQTTGDIFRCDVNDCDRAKNIASKMPIFSFRINGLFPHAKKEPRSMYPWY